MQFKGRLECIRRNNSEYVLTFATGQNVFQQAVELKGKELRLDVKRWRNKRSINANGLFWHCVGEIADVMGVDKESVYEMMLKRYGLFTYLVAKPDMIKHLKKVFRIVEQVDVISVNNKNAVQVKCTLGSSNYDTKSMSKLIDGTISEMVEMGLQPPIPEDIKQALERWEEYTNGKEY